MRALLQRVTEASVTVDGLIVGRIDRGILVFLGVGPDDNHDDITWLTQKIINLRLFNDDQGLMNLSLTDQGYSVLVVSQFTLMASLKKGTRPSFSNAAKPDTAEKLYLHFIAELSQKVNVASGKFGADMKVRLLNDGPVTFMLDSRLRDF